MIQRAAFVVSLCLVVAPLTARAQALPGAKESRYRGLHLGVSAGVNFSDIRNPYDFPDPQIHHGVAAGASFGLLVGYQFDDTFALRTGLHYSRLGRQAEETFRIEGRDVPIEKTVDLDYVQVPVLLRLNIGPSLTGFYTQFGLQYSRLQQARVVRNGQGQDTDRLFNDTELGLVLEVGAGYAFTGPFYVTLGLRGYLGFTDINHKDLETTGFLVGKSQNVAGGLHLALNYRLTRRP